MKTGSFFWTVKDSDTIYVKARIKAEFMKTHYDVAISFTSDGDIIQTQCECGVGMGPIDHCKHMSQCMRFPTMWLVRPVKPQISLRIRAVWSEPLLVAWVFYDCYSTDWTPFGVSKLKRRLQRLTRVYTCHNVKLLDNSCSDSYMLHFVCIIYVCNHRNSEITWNLHRKTTDLPSDKTIIWSPLKAKKNLTCKELMNLPMLTLIQGPSSLNKVLATMIILEMSAWIFLEFQRCFFFSCVFQQMQRQWPMLMTIYVLHRKIIF